MGFQCWTERVRAERLKLEKQAASMLLFSHRVPAMVAERGASEGVSQGVINSLVHQSMQLAQLLEERSEEIGRAKDNGVALTSNRSGLPWHALEAMPIEEEQAETAPSL